MPSLRSIIAALALLAAAVNPLAAALMPCCCWGSDSACSRCAGEVSATNSEHPSGCCRAAAAASPVPACCAKQVQKAPACCQAETADGMSPVFSPAGNCDCEVATAPAMLVRDRELLSADQYEPLLAISPLDKVDFAAAPRCGDADDFSPKTPNGPSLLALYCIWLK